MNKSELIATVAEKTGRTKKETELIASSIIETIKETVAKGESVQLIGFGSFECKQRAARIARNPQTGEEIEVAASKIPAFRVGKSFKDALK